MYKRFVVHTNGGFNTLSITYDGIFATMVNGF